ncbi:hypothetical protein [Bacillus gobiensis]|uniref:hypothetical protein n=1 Tax=Bacillus gobiensis TaxID=1441095 RepID=UPI003D20FD1C
MFLITYKKGLNAEKSKIEFDHPLTFSKANEMLAEAVTRYKQTGQSMKVSYKIIEIETGESIFNSKILIDHDIPSLLQLIKENRNAPKPVIEYVTKVDNREVIEEDDAISFNNHIEEKARLEQLKAEKNDILHQLKEDEKERRQRDIEHQKKMKEIQAEKEALEKSIQLKEKEEEVKESQRIEALRRLEEEKTKAMQLMEEKRSLDKEKKEDHEKRLKEVEDEAKKAEIELASINAELEKKELERKKEIQALEEKKLDADRKVNVLKAKGDKDEVKHQHELIINYKNFNEGPKSNQQMTSVIPKLTLKERLQELDFKEVKSRSKQFVKSSVKGSLNGSKKAFTLLKTHHAQRTAAKEEKPENLNKQVEIEEKLALEKIKFMDELRKERQKQEKEIRKAAKQKERESLQKIKIENRYRAAKKRSLGRYPIYSGGTFKFIIGTVGVAVAALGCIYYFDLGSSYPILNDVKNFIDKFL